MPYKLVEWVQKAAIQLKQSRRRKQVLAPASSKMISEVHSIIIYAYVVPLEIDQVTKVKKGLDLRRLLFGPLKDCTFHAFRKKLRVCCREFRHVRHSDS